MGLSQAELANIFTNILGKVPIEFVELQTTLTDLSWPFSGDKIARIKYVNKLDQCLASDNNGKTVCHFTANHLGVHERHNYIF